MWYLITTAILTITVIFHTSFLEAFKFMGLVPNLTLILFVYLSVYEDFKRTFILALIAGFLMDILSTGTFGFYIFFFMLAAIVIDMVKYYIGRTKSLSLVMIITAVASFVLIVFETILIIATKGASVGIILPVLKHLSFGAIASIIGAAIFKPVFQRIYSIIGRDRNALTYE